MSPTRCLEHSRCLSTIARDRFSLHRHKRKIAVCGKNDGFCGPGPASNQSASSHRKTRLSRHSSPGAGALPSPSPARSQKGPKATSGRQWRIWRCGWGDGRWKSRWPDQRAGKWGLMNSPMPGQKLSSLRITKNKATKPDPNFSSFPISAIMPPICIIVNYSVSVVFAI